MSTRHDLAEAVRASRAAQGLPAHVDDRAVLRRVAALLSERDDARGFEPGRQSYESLASTDTPTTTTRRRRGQG